MPVIDFYFFNSKTLSVHATFFLMSSDFTKMSYIRIEMINGFKSGDDDRKCFILVRPL